MDYYGEHIETVVIDPGSVDFKAGFAEDSSPQLIIASAVGIKDARFAGPSLESLLNKKEIDGLVIKHPLANPHEPDTDTLLALYEHAFAALGVSAEKAPLLIAEPAETPPSAREKVAAMAFEELRASALFFAKQPALCCFAAGRYTGLVLDVGGAAVTCVPVSDGYVLKAEMQTAPVAGNWQDRFLQSLLMDRAVRVVEDAAVRANGSVCEHVEGTILRSIKEAFCVVLSDKAEMQKIEAKDYKLPDGRLIEITPNDRYSGAEALFQPQSQLFDTGDFAGLPKMVVNSLLSCDADLRKTLIGNVVVAGRGFLFKGLYKRLYAGVNAILPPALNRLKIIMPSDSIRRNFEVVWVGGSILGSLSTFKQLLVTRAEYEESGAAILREKCP